MKFCKGDIIANECGQQFYVVNDTGHLKLLTNVADGFGDEFRLVASTFPEMTGKAGSGDIEYEEVKPEPVIDLTSLTSEVEDDMFLKDIVAEEMKDSSFKYNSIEFMSKTGMLMHNAHGNI